MDYQSIVIYYEKTATDLTIRSQTLIANVPFIMMKHFN